jgi:hypothetical protein
MLLGGLLMGWLIWAGSPAALLASLGSALAVLGVLLVWAGLIVHQLNYLLIGPRRLLRPAEQTLQSLLHERGLMPAGVATILFGGLGFVWLGLQAGSLSTATATLISGVLTLAMAAGMAALTCGVVSRVIWAVNEKQRASVHHAQESAGVRELPSPVQSGLSSELLHR